MANNISIEDLQRSTVIDQDGDKVGKVGQVYLDDATGQPNWVTVNTGLFGGSETFIPLDEATQDGDDLRVPYTKAFIKDAPNLDADSHVDESQEDELYRYYGLQGGGDQVRDGRDGRDGRGADLGGKRLLHEWKPCRFLRAVSSRVPGVLTPPSHRAKAPRRYLAG